MDDSTHEGLSLQILLRKHENALEGVQDNMRVALAEITSLREQVAGLKEELQAERDKRQMDRQATINELTEVVEDQIRNIRDDVREDLAAEAKDRKERFEQEMRDQLRAKMYVLTQDITSLQRDADRLLTETTEAKSRQLQEDIRQIRENMESIIEHPRVLQTLQSEVSKHVKDQTADLVTMIHKKANLSMVRDLDQVINNAILPTQRVIMHAMLGLFRFGADDPTIASPNPFLPLETDRIFEADLGMSTSRTTLSNPIIVSEEMHKLRDMVERSSSRNPRPWENRPGNMLAATGVHGGSRFGADSDGAIGSSRDTPSSPDPEFVNRIVAQLEFVTKELNTKVTRDQVLGMLAASDINRTRFEAVEDRLGDLQRKALGYDRLVSAINMKMDKIVATSLLNQKADKDFVHAEIRRLADRFGRARTPAASSPSLAPVSPKSVTAGVFMDIGDDAAAGHQSLSPAPSPAPATTPGTALPSISPSAVAEATVRRKREPDERLRQKYTVGDNTSSVYLTTSKDEELDDQAVADRLQAARQSKVARKNKLRGRS